MVSVARSDQRPAKKRVKSIHNTIQYIHFIQHVLRRSAQHNSARLRVFALHQIGEVLVANFANVEQAAAGADILE
jgi:hypothetical protein